MKTSRRAFLRSALVGTSGLWLASRVSGAETATVKPDPYRLMPLGRTGIKVTLVSQGTGTHGGVRETDQTRLGRDRLVALLKAGYDRGIRFFDTADKYGSHSHIAEALKGIPRNHYVLQSKIWRHRGGLPEDERPDANVLLDRFRKELNTDYIDVVILHCMMSGKWPEEQKAQMDILADLKSKKIIRAHGVSVHTLDALRAAAECPWVDVIFARINAFGTAMDGPPAEVAPLLKKMKADGKGVMAMKLIGNGEFRNHPDKIDKSIRYVLDLDCVDTMVVGFETAAQIDDFASRVTGVMKAKAAG